MEVRKGYKKTEVGVIPNDWDVKRLRDIFTLKSGYAFSSNYFSNEGPIVITPGNFKLNGGLNFNDKNTNRYSGSYSSSMQFKYGDLVIVMTDLTPDCNLLGKPGYVKLNEIILHNQRIGKISLTSTLIHIDYLYWFFLSEFFSRRMKETATGSTVRHTSNSSIYNTYISIPSKVEQTAIANVISETDALINSIENLISKKRNIKQGAMQKLLTFKPDWELKRLEEITEIKRGASPRPIENPIWFEENSEIGWVRISDVTKSKKYLNSTIQSLSKLGIKNSRYVEKGSLIMSICATVGRPIITNLDVCIHDGFVFFDNLKIDKEYLYYYLMFIESNWGKNGQTGSQMNLNTNLINSTIIPLPRVLLEQKRIASILSEMDAEITALENKLEKYKKIKTGMMQNLLTGKIRLV
ncbi:type I restriction enzyme, S subunit [Chitinophaga sp. CF118]|uniref:restriction endonuclease subunit S n=1 Tax=Chitinophaga sp. CF118 TaxID=1884367 RepID=UPI0008E8DD5E|nr:restriction endonuclease subunit S [Chitinophaga sp. CF118]SFD65029.1 type I restriction enzyme, S subunit [Chitinophaga sp. CF118]